MPLDSISLLPVVVGTPIVKLKLVRSPKPLVETKWWVQLEGAEAPKVHGPLSDEDVSAMVDMGDINANSLLWQAPWPMWERVHRSKSLVWVYERAELLALESDDFDIDFEASLFDEPTDSLWDTFMAGQAQEPTLTVHDAKVYDFKAKAVGVRRVDSVGNIAQIAALLLAISSGVALWVSRLPSLLG